MRTEHVSRARGSTVSSFAAPAYFGNAVGAWIGAVALIHGEPYDRLPWIEAALAAMALVLTVVSYRLDATLARPALPTT